jgi:predicted nuclease with TOPRIM domain
VLNVISNSRRWFMKQQLVDRLQELKAEFESGQKALAEMEAKQANMRNTLLRISGAIQVLEEELAKAAKSSGEKEQETLQEEGMLKQAVA